jgi:hypothetical protein
MYGAPQMQILRSHVQPTLRVKTMATKTIFPIPLARETRVTLPTAEAAFHLNRAQQTLRLWAMREDGPIRPIRVHGRLAWPVADLCRVLGIAEAA